MLFRMEACRYYRTFKTVGVALPELFWHGCNIVLVLLCREEPHAPHSPICLLPERARGMQGVAQSRYLGQSALPTIVFERRRTDCYARSPCVFVLVCVRTGTNFSRWWGSPLRSCGDTTLQRLELCIHPPRI